MKKREINNFSIVSLFKEVIVEFVREIYENKETLLEELALSSLIVICFTGALFFGFLWYFNLL
ncbi:hypothetical protein [uncultured Campylobacter sp.]|uniref:hypothetical protein n=1 Tax=uncultured Campylobacter sp. TaxID=218934 RepID=UPI00262BE5BE|nr:hypothetical protein [uncultured Campylobacter sp.]